MKVAIAQINPTLGDVDRNAALHRDWIDRAHRRGADLVVFPELSLTGYLLQDLAQDLAMDLGHSPVSRRLASASERISVMAGTAEVTGEFRFHNTAVLYEDGRLAHVHRKVYLPTYAMFDEGRYFAPGDRFRVHRSTRLGRLGVLVCEDAWHLSASYLLAQGGADLLCILSAGPVRGMRAGAELASRAAWRDLCRVTAQFNTTYVLYCNRVGQEEGWTFSGGSLAVDPLGNVLAEAGPDEEEMLLVEVEPDRLREARTLYPLLRDERAHLVSRELNRLLRARAESPEVEDE
jgi:predicted amidohydrolase